MPGSSRTASFPRPDLDEFLFAPIADDGEMPVTVLSALARMDVDPWHEAAKLAGLPGELAIKRLTGLLAALPGGPSADGDPGAIAGRLVALLPRPGSTIAIPSGATMTRVAGAIGPRTRIVLLVAAVVLGGLSFVVGRPSPEDAADAQARASSATYPRSSPPGTGRQ